MRYQADFPAPAPTTSIPPASSSHLSRPPTPPFDPDTREAKHELLEAAKLQFNQPNRASPNPPQMSTELSMDEDGLELMQSLFPVTSKVGESSSLVERRPVSPMTPIPTTPPLLSSGLPTAPSSLPRPTIDPRQFDESPAEDNTRIESSPTMDIDERISDDEVEDMALAKKTQPGDHLMEVDEDSGNRDEEMPLSQVPQLQDPMSVDDEAEKVEERIPKAGKSQRRSGRKKQSRKIVNSDGEDESMEVPRTKKVDKGKAKEVTPSSFESEEDNMPPSNQLQQPSYQLHQSSPPLQQVLDQTFLTNSLTEEEKLEKEVLALFKPPTQTDSGFTTANGMKILAGVLRMSKNYQKHQNMILLLYQTRKRIQFFGTHLQEAMHRSPGYIEGRLLILLTEWPCRYSKIAEQ
jgi:hypothetical protein